MSTQNNLAKNVFSIIQILFRFLRILLLIRKVLSEGVNLKIGLKFQENKEREFDKDPCRKDN